MLQLAIELEALAGLTFYDHVAQCNVAMAVNDMVTLGPLPFCYSQYLAAGSSDWFKNEKRWRDLVKGTKQACILARCVWGGGETPTLRDIIMPGAVDLAGATVGFVQSEERLIRPDRIMSDDAIVIIESSGIHANGLTLAREIAKKLPDGFLTRLSDGRTYGETLLDPTRIYVPIVEDCQNSGVHIHYAVNVTGHGWRKIMRARQSFTYVIDVLPRQLPIFDFIQEHGPVDDREAYGNLNMGAGFVLFVPQSDLSNVWDVLESYDAPDRFGAVIAGHVENGPKKVVIKPKRIEFLGSELGVR
ncbi:AIR synthase-related protein, partial [Candidatus Magnetobacterium casense]